MLWWKQRNVEERKLNDTQRKEGVPRNRIWNFESCSQDFEEAGDED